MKYSVEDFLCMDIQQLIVRLSKQKTDNSRYTSFITGYTSDFQNMKLITSYLLSEF